MKANGQAFNVDELRHDVWSLLAEHRELKSDVLEMRFRLVEMEKVLPVLPEREKALLALPERSPSWEDNAVSQLQADVADLKKQSADSPHSMLPSEVSTVIRDAVESEVSRRIQAPTKEAHSNMLPSELSTIVQDAVESTVTRRLEELIQRIGVLEAQTAGQVCEEDPDVPKPPEDHVESRGSTISPMSLSNHHPESSGFESVETEVAMENNVWEASLLFNLQQMDTAASALLMAALVVNIVVQLAFIVVIYRVFLTEQLPEVEDVRTWRELHAHHSDNMIVATRTSLVRAVCDGDQSLITATGQQTLLSVIDKYTRSPLVLLGFAQGPVVCLLVLLHWIMVVIKECRQSVAFAHVVRHLPRDRETKLRTSKMGHEFISIGNHRFVFILLLSLVRCSIAILLGISGSIWQAQTLDIQELLLNAAGLAMVMETDELVFHSMVPDKVKTVIANMKPFRYASIQYKGVGCNVAVTLMISLSCATATFVLYVLHNLEVMDEIEQVMCGGLKDFVVYAHDKLNILVATGSNKIRDRKPWLEEQNRQGLTAVSPRAVRTMINSKELTSSARITKVMYIDMSDQFDYLRVASFEQLSAFFSRSILGASCEDYDFAAPDAFHAFKSAIERTFRGAKTCADLIPHCQKHMRLVRMLCPATCGCNQPHSGLFPNGPNQGCPRQACLASSTYTSQLASIPCKDYSPPELLEIPGWTAFLNEWLGTNRLLKMSDVDQLRNQFRNQGCLYLGHLAPTIKSMLCRDNPEYGSISPYCPVSCGCQNRSQADCPTQCSFTIT